jgi:hypothetical protein
MTLNASLDRFFEDAKSTVIPLTHKFVAEKLIEHLARDGFTILPAEDLAEWTAWKEGDLD